MIQQASGIQIADGLEIPRDEISFSASRSSGPGGQNVNKVATRVSLLFDLAASRSLSDEQKERIAERLSGRINRAGVLRVTSQREWSQGANRRLAMERFAELLREALAPETPRRATRMPSQAKRRRLEEKRRQAELKRLRRPPSGDD